MKTKVLHIEDWFNPETGYQINYFARNHHPNFDFHILTSNSLDLWGIPNYDKEQKAKDKLFEKNYDVKIHRLPSRIQGKRHNRWLIGLVNTIKTIDPDIIFAHCIESFTSSRIFLNSSIRKKYKIVTDTHTVYSQFGKGVGYKLFLKFLQHVITPIITKNNILAFYTTEENQQILKDTYKIPQNLIKKSTISSDLRTFYYDQKAGKEIRNQYNIPKTAFLIIYTGKLDEHKQPHLLLEAVSKMHNENIYTMFVGAKNNDYYTTRFTPLITNPEKTILVDNQKNTDLYKFYSAANIAVFPKQNTLSALDAQACRLPVIMENDFTNQIRLEHGGLLYKLGDTDSLASVIEKVASDSELQKELADKGSAFIKKNYDYQLILKNVENELFKLSI